MRTVLTSGGIPTFISGREHEFLEKFENKPILKKSLNEQEAEMARVLASRGVLNRYRDEERGIYYVKNQNKGI